MTSIHLPCFRKPQYEALRRPEVDYGTTECGTYRLQMEHALPEKKTVHPLQILAAACAGAELKSII